MVLTLLIIAMVISPIAWRCGVILADIVGDIRTQRTAQNAEQRVVDAIIEQHRADITAELTNRKPKLVLHQGGKREPGPYAKAGRS